MILLYTLVVLAASALGAYVSTGVTEKGFRTLIQDQSGTAARTSESLIEMLAQTSLMLAKEVASDDRLQGLLRGGSDGRLGAFVSEHMERTSSDSLVILDGEGRVVAGGGGGGGAPGAGDSLASWNFVRKSLEERLPETAVVSDGNRFILYSTGVVEGEGDAALVIAGYFINDRLAAQIRKTTGAEVTVVRDRAVMASTLVDENSGPVTDLPMPYLEYQMLLEGGGEVVESTLFGRRYFVTAVPLHRMERNMTGSIMFAFPADGLAAVKGTLYRRNIAVFAFAFLLAAVVGVSLSKKVTGSIEGLIEATRKVTEGDLDAGITLRSEDELGILASNFESMVSSLREKEARLTSLSRNLKLEVAVRTEELHRANIELKKSEHRLEEAQRIAGVGDWEWDYRAGKFTCSDEFLRILGLPGPALDGGLFGLLALVHPEDKEFFNGRVEKALGEGRLVSFDHRVVLKDGSVRVVHERIKAAMAGDDEPLRLAGTIRDITEMKLMEERLNRLARTDTLTSAFNRAKLEEILPREMEMVRRHEQLLSIAIFDLDHFKEINDRYGHLAGDKVLSTVADIVRKYVRKTDYFIRWGGEEFLLVLPGSDLSGAKVLAERIRRAVEDHRFDEEFRVTVSFGVAEHREGETEDGLLKKADTALYAAKSGGRNRVVTAA